MQLKIIQRLPER